MTTNRDLLIIKILPYLQKAEIVFLILLVSAVFMLNMGKNTASIVILALSGLSVIFFINAYIPDLGPNKSRTFRDILALLAPKIMWIACSIGLIGILFSLLGLAGAREMMLISALSIGSGFLVLAILFLSGLRSIVNLTPLFYRAIPVVLATIYLLVN